MSSDSSFVIDTLAEHVWTIVTGFLAAAAGSILFMSRLLVKREVKHMDERHAILMKMNSDVMETNRNLDTRVRYLEANVATRADIDRLYDHVGDTGKQSEARHNQMLELLVKKLGD